MFCTHTFSPLHEPKSYGHWFVLSFFSLSAPFESCAELCLRVGRLWPEPRCSCAGPARARRSSGREPPWGTSWENTSNGYNRYKGVIGQDGVHSASKLLGWHIARVRFCGLSTHFWTFKGQVQASCSSAARLMHRLVGI
eukprot:2598093-Amphidinium_carterae.1